MPALVEREELSGPMKEALRRHIIREREKKMREEKEAEKDFERRAKIEEERRRKEEEDSVNLEQIKEQLSALREKEESLKVEKHQLFRQLKKVLQQEDEKKKQKLKNELAASHAHFAHSLPNMGGYQVMQEGHYQPHHHMQYLAGHSQGIAAQSSPHVHPSLRHSMNQPHQASPASHQGVKRPHSPGSPQPSPIQMYQRSALAAQGHLPSTPQHQKYDHGFGSHLTISNLANSSSQSSIHGTPSRHISVLHSSSSPSGRPSGPRSPYSLGKQLEIASQKSGFGDEGGNALIPLRGRPTIRMLPQPAPLMPQQLSSSPRSRSGSPGRYSMHSDRSRSPFHSSNPMPGGRYYK